MIIFYIFSLVCFYVKHFGLLLLYEKCSINKVWLIDYLLYILHIFDIFLPSILCNILCNHTSNNTDYPFNNKHCRYRNTEMQKNAAVDTTERRISLLHFGREHDKNKVQIRRKPVSTPEVVHRQRTCLHWPWMAIRCQSALDSIQIELVFHKKSTREGFPECAQTLKTPLGSLSLQLWVEGLKTGNSMKTRWMILPLLLQIKPILTFLYTIKTFSTEAGA